MNIHTRGSFGSSEGCGTRIIVPERSYLRLGSRLVLVSARRAALSTTKDVPMRLLTLHPLLGAEARVLTRNMLELAILKHSEPHGDFRLRLRLIMKLDARRRLRLRMEERR